MCKICDGYSNGEVCKKIRSEFIRIGYLGNVWALELWLMTGSKENHSEASRLNVALTETESGDDISYFNVPIKYCPFCGKKL